MGQNCCSEVKDTPGNLPKGSKKEKQVVEDNLSNDSDIEIPKLSNDSWPIKLNKNDKRVVDLNANLIEVLANDQFYGLTKFFKNLTNEQSFLVLLRDIDNFDEQHFPHDDTGTIYKGDLSDSLFSSDFFVGFGVLFSEKGNLSIGQRYNNKQQGLGFFKRRDESWYRGDFSEDMKNGTGLFTFSDGSTYKGEMKNDEIEGKGLYKWTNGDIYDGFFKEGKMHTNEGQVSTFYNANKSIYVGEYKYDKKSGIGKFNYHNADVVYDGEWLNGKQHGKGAMIIYNKHGVEKKREEGIWQDGKRLPN